MTYVFNKWNTYVLTQPNGPWNEASLNFTAFYHNMVPKKMPQPSCISILQEIMKTKNKNQKSVNIIPKTKTNRTTFIIQSKFLQYKITCYILESL